MIKRLIGATVVALCLGGAAVSAAAPPTTTPPAAPVPAPAPTQQPTGLGTDGAMDLLANACFNGTMQACDDLYAQSPAGSAYETFGDTCAGRQPAATGRFCSDVFTDAVVQQTSPTTTSPTTVAGAVTATMGAIHTICKPEALTAYAADYATKVPPTLQGIVAGMAEEQGMTVDAFLGAVLDDSLDSETQITVIDAYQPAEAPVGEATLTEYGLLTGRYLDCLVEATQVPQDIFDNLLNTAEGSGTWAGYTMTWGDNDDGDLTITFTSAGAAPASTTPVTTTPATPTTAPAAPTTRHRRRLHQQHRPRLRQHPRPFPVAPASPKRRPRSTPSTEWWRSPAATSSPSATSRWTRQFPAAVQRHRGERSRRLQHLHLRPRPRVLLDPRGQRSPDGVRRLLGLPGDGQPEPLHRVRHGHPRLLPRRQPGRHTTSVGHRRIGALSVPDAITPAAGTKMAASPRAPAGARVQPRARVARQSRPRW